MKDHSLLVQCDTVSHNKTQLAIRFIVPMPTEPGKPVTSAKTIVTIVYSEAKEVATFVPGESYLITLAAAKGNEKKETQPPYKK